MISRIDHIAFAVRDFTRVADFFRSILGAVPGTSSVDPDLKYLAQVFSLGDLTRIELLNPTDKGSFLDNFLAQRQGVHHICLETPDILKVRSVLEERGIPYFGFHAYAGGSWKELFIHPRDAFGILIQIAEFTPDDFISDSLKLKGDARWSAEKSPTGVTLTLKHPGGGTVRVDLTKDEAAALQRDLGKALRP